ncbi:MAG: hypothetical protein LHV68_05185 [Elusimicrobia bacterium]|nr:hypothetical protein [Candidatus Liberimonas magnetica]
MRKFISKVENVSATVLTLLIIDALIVSGVYELVKLNEVNLKKEDKTNG